MSDSLPTCGRDIAGPPLPPITEHPIEVADLLVDGQRIAVWADRPARGLTKIMLVDASSNSSGDATLHGVTLTVSLPDTWSAADRAAVTCLISHIVHQDEPAARITATEPLWQASASASPTAMVGHPADEAPSARISSSQPRPATPNS